jgi:hypothetical protein
MACSGEEQRIYTSLAPVMFAFVRIHACSQPHHDFDVEFHVYVDVFMILIC